MRRKRECAPYPAVKITSEDYFPQLYFNTHTKPFLFGPHIVVTKADIKGEAYMCFKNSDILGYDISKTGRCIKIPAMAALGLSGIPISAFGVRRCVRIQGGVAFKIIQ